MLYLIFIVQNSIFESFLINTFLNSQKISKFFVGDQSLLETKSFPSVDERAVYFHVMSFLKIRDLIWFETKLLPSKG